MTVPHSNLRLSEAVARFEAVTVSSYDVRLDLAADEATFGSITTIRFTGTGAPTFLDLEPLRVNGVRLNGAWLDADRLARGRLPISPAVGDNELVVDAVMGFRNDGEGLHAHVDPADGRRYVYGMSFMDAAPSVFACFDQPDLKAPLTLHVTAPTEWTVIGNAPGTQVEPGTWEFEETRPLSTYFVTLVAGPYHVIHEEHAGIALGLSCRQSIAKDLDADADELFTLTRQCFEEYHRLFGIRYPFGNYHQAFVPEFNAGAMENPGCVTYRDPLVFSSRVTRGTRIKRATTMAHEMAHQWFGNITTPKWWDDLWLNESFAEYMGNRVTADVTQYADAWTHNAYARRQWGLVADQRPSTHPVAGNGAVDAATALQDFDGISYNKGASILKQLNRRLGDEVFLAGVTDHLATHRFGNATMHDLFASWEAAGAGDLREFTGSWLRTAGPDQLLFDPAAGVVRRTAPAGNEADRTHELRVATARPGEPWRLRELTCAGTETPLEAGEGTAVVLDPYEDTWALVRPDDATTPLLPALLPTTTDDGLRAGIWNNVRSGFHVAAIAPETVVGLVEAMVPSEDNDDAISHVLPWATDVVVPLSGDPAGALARIHDVTLDRAHATEAGSTLQLAAFQAAVASAADEDRLTSWLDRADLPDGLEVDTDLRWLILVRLATLGATDRTDLDRHLAAEPTARSRVEHARAVASVPAAEAKAWAWARFTGEVPASNYEIEACGLGMWRAGQEHVTDPYVDRYFTEVRKLADVHSGWLLADVAESFFPLTSLRPGTLDGADQLIADDGLDPALRRAVTDRADELRRRIAVRSRFGS